MLHVWWVKVFLFVKKLNLQPMEEDRSWSSSRPAPCPARTPPMSEASTCNNQFFFFKSTQLFHQPQIKGESSLCELLTRWSAARRAPWPRQAPRRRLCGLPWPTRRRRSSGGRWWSQRLPAAGDGAGRRRRRCSGGCRKRAWPSYSLHLWIVIADERKRRESEVSLRRRHI